MTVREFQDLIKFYERTVGLSFRDSIEAALQKAIKDETERCARIAEDFPTSENTNLPNGIAQEIRRPLRITNE